MKKKQQDETFWDRRNDSEEFKRKRVKNSWGERQSIPSTSSSCTTQRIVTEVCCYATFHNSFTARRVKRTRKPQQQPVPERGKERRVEIVKSTDKRVNKERQRESWHIREGKRQQLHNPQRSSADGQSKWKANIRNDRCNKTNWYVATTLSRLWTSKTFSQLVDRI